ncbi:MAG: hypothetical protein H7287_03235 [Thermoleophilia bacterium]|nr:hypothetical protein [Thermoleophilia bacterium]
MHDGWGYVLATYMLVAVTLGTWFAMILTKLARAKRARGAITPAAEVSQSRETPDD